jgi:uncharacterized protein (TIGR03437 family)
MKKLLSATLLLVALFSGAAPARAQSLETSEVEAAQLINAERVRLGLNPLQISQKLTQVGDWMTSDMSSRGLVPSDHRDSLGRDAIQRLNALGYNYNTAKGEILAKDYATAAAVVAAWVASPTHYDAIKNPKYRVLGVSRLGNYWAVEFGGFVDTLMQADIGPVGYATAVNAASNLDGGSPGMLATVYGVFLNGSTASEIATTLPLPTTMLTLEVRVDGQAAPLVYVSNFQINFQIPTGVGTGTKMVDVYRAGTLVSRGNLTVAATFGAIFTAKMTGSGAPAGFLRVGAQYIPLFDAAREPVGFTPSAETYLELYGTGLSAYTKDTLKVYLEYAPEQYADLEVTYVGPQGQFVGLDQLNVRIPAGLAAFPGTRRLRLFANGNWVGNTTEIVFK